MRNPGEGSLRVRPQDVEWRAVDGEVVVLDLRTSRYLAVNGSGAALWAALAGGCTRAGLAGILRDTYGRTSDDAEREAAEFVDACARLQLLA